MTCERSSGGCKNQNVEKLEQLPWDGEMLATKHANSEQEVKRKNQNVNCNLSASGDSSVRAKVSMRINVLTHSLSILSSPWHHSFFLAGRALFL